MGKLTNKKKLNYYQMEQKDNLYHGTLEYAFEANWKAPKMVAECDKLARPHYTNLKAHEYNDDEEVLNQKLDILANLIMVSENFVAYTGAGISTNAGIKDYATKAEKSTTKKTD